MIDLVVITQGHHPEALRACIESAMAQSSVALNVICVGNGWPPTGLPEGVTTVFEPENLGVPGGRNVGAAYGDAPFIMFLDDDAQFATTDGLAKLIAYFNEHPRVGLVQPRIADPTTGYTEPRWIPRSVAGNPARPGNAFTIAEGVSIVRRDVFEDIGGWAEQFFYGHEGIELTWQVWDRGYRARYVPEVTVYHPAGAPLRNAEQIRMNARNRVWVAKRNLPTGIRHIYLTTWWLAMMLRLRTNSSSRAQWRRGWQEGQQSPHGRQRQIRWRTVARLALLGHPPIF